MDVMWPVRGGSLEIPGGAGGCKEKCLEKNSRSHCVRERKFMQANSKVQIVFEKISCETGNFLT
jgi:hypothetical protein